MSHELLLQSCELCLQLHLGLFLYIENIHKKIVLTLLYILVLLLVLFFLPFVQYFPLVKIIGQLLSKPGNFLLFFLSFLKYRYFFLIFILIILLRIILLFTFRILLHPNILNLYFLLFLLLLF